VYHFRNDYSVGCHPQVLEVLAAVNGEYVTGYGNDPYSRSCADLVRELCQAPKADVRFLMGGTQANLTVIAALLRPWESVLCAATGHVNGHEAGAVESTGHKLLTVQTAADGKLLPAQLRPVLDACADEHVTKPGLVYISDATETGGVYTKAELEALSQFCRKNGLLLFLDGARLGCALGAQPNDLTLPDLAALTDAFTIGGTKNGAMFGEVLVLPEPTLQPDLFRGMKQRGAVLAKGWLTAVQFQALLKDGLYFKLGRHSVEVAQYLQGGLKNLGIPLMTDSPSNQIFPILPDALLPRLSEICTYEVWGGADRAHTVIRLVTSFTSRLSDVEGLLQALKSIS